MLVTLEEWASLNFGLLLNCEVVMGLESWKEEFYPVSAEQAAANSTELQIVKHSLDKWTGMRSVCLKRHEVSVDHYGDIVDHINAAELVINGDSCALCWRHSKPLLRREKCTSCPIVLATGNRCDDGNPPWDKWLENHNPEPMIAALEKALKWVEDNG